MNVCLFRHKLEHLINECSMESGSNTPDYVLAEYLMDCLEAYEKVVRLRNYHSSAPRLSDLVNPPSLSPSLPPREETAGERPQYPSPFGTMIMDSSIIDLPPAGAPEPTVEIRSATEVGI